MESTVRPFVSVVTPVHDGERYLAECIESVLAQTHQDWELVIVDNHSSDRTRDIACSYAMRDPRVRVVTNPAFVDVIENHNIACREVSPHSRYCKILQADDWLFPGCLAEMIAVAEAHPRVGVVGSYVLHGDGVRCDGLPHPSTVVEGRALCRRNLLGQIHTFLSPTALLFRADLVRERERFFPGNQLHADVAACYEILERTDFGFVHQVLSHVRRHDDSLTATWAGRFDTLPLSLLELLARYGPVYLTDAECAARRRRLTRKHYDSLARTLWSSRERGAIWRLHGERLRALGHPLSPYQLARSYIRAALSRLARI
jgi:glycosyltransferase involved in cell wall biosynthesis